MSPDLHEELVRLREDLSACMQETLPAREFGAALMLGTVRLGMIEASIRKTHNLEERRRLINEFGDKRDILEKSIALLRKSARRGDVHTEQKLRRVLP